MVPNGTFEHAQNFPARILASIITTEDILQLFSLACHLPSPVMPPRFIPLSHIIKPVTAQATPAFLLPFLHIPYRNASILSSLRDNPGSFRRRKRVGRGASSGVGKTSGRGHKGQKQHGKVPSGMIGGETPHHVLKPPKGKANTKCANFQSFLIDVPFANV